MKKTCPKCEQHKDLCEFNNNKSKKDGKQRLCRLCSRQEHKNWYNRGDNKKIQLEKNKIVFKNKKDKFTEYKKSCKCEKCGENRWYVLDFHHLDPSQKDFEISGSIIAKSSKDFWKEISKCIPLCRNCHTEFHFLERTENILISDYICARNSAG